jgi:hypothetical protein
LKGVAAARGVAQVAERVRAVRGRVPIAIANVLLVSAAVLLDEPAHGARGAARDAADARHGRARRGGEGHVRLPFFFVVFLSLGSVASRRRPATLFCLRALFRGKETKEEKRRGHARGRGAAVVGSVRQKERTNERVPILLIRGLWA